MKPKVTVTWIPPLKELMEVMDEFYGGPIPREGSAPTLNETDYLPEKTDESEDEDPECDAEVKAESTSTKKLLEDEDQKPEFTLVPGNLVDDRQMLINLYTKLTGREPTEAEIEEAMKKDSSES